MSELSGDWWRIRKEILERDNWECQECGCSEEERPLEVHHITPRKDGGSDDSENLKTLCAICHLTEHGATTGPDNLGETDKEILELLQVDRETVGSMADQLNKHPQTIRDRLKWLQEWEYVEKYHDTTGLYEIAPQNGDD